VLGDNGLTGGTSARRKAVTTFPRVLYVGFHDGIHNNKAISLLSKNSLSVFI
jgi:hypothetical protein